MPVEQDDVEIKTKDGTLTAFHAYPEDAGQYPGVILYMDAPGIREELRDFARRIAGEGYFCILPDFYYRWGRIRLQGKRDPASVETYRAARRQLSNALVVDDTAAILDFLDGHPRVKPGGYGCVGFCQSGRFITTVAGRFRGLRHGHRHRSAGLAAPARRRHQGRAVLRLRRARRPGAGQGDRDAERHPRRAQGEERGGNLPHHPPRLLLPAPRHLRQGRGGTVLGQAVRAV
jgi:dienelactone hydrolase